MITPDRYDSQDLLRTVLARLQVVRGPDGKGEYTCWCPFHPDGKGKPPHEPNLRVSERGYYCYACKEKGSLRTLAHHLKVQLPASARRQAATWDYYAPDGSAKVFQKCRFETPHGKTYVLRREAPGDWRECVHRAECQKQKRDCHDGWVWTLAAKPCMPAPAPVLYKQPVLSVVLEGPVYVAEGEKCCDSLAELDLVGVCNPFGAGEWRIEYSQALSGRDVVICADSDKAGRDHGEIVARSLAGGAASIKVIDLYPDRNDGSDIADWIAAQEARLKAEGVDVHDITAPVREELEALIAAAPNWTAPQGSVTAGTPSSSSSPIGSDSDDDLNQAPVELRTLAKPGPRRWVVEGFIPTGAPTTLFGSGGLAKSLVGMLVGDCVARGQSLFGRAVQQGRVLYLDWELDRDEQIRRAYRVAAGLDFPSPPPGLFYKQMLPPLGEALPQIEGWLKDLQISLTIIDSFGLATRGDPTAAKDVVPLMAAVSRLPCTSLFIDHVRNLQPGEKGGDLNPFGSVYKFNIARSVLRVIKVAGDEISLSLLLRQTKSNFGALSEPLGLRVAFEEDKVLFERLSLSSPIFAEATDYLPACEKVYQALLATESASPGELAKQTLLSIGTVKNQLTRLRHQGKAEPVGEGRWKATGESSSSSSLSDDDDDEPAAGGQ